MKKIIAFVLCILLILSMGTSVLAEETVTGTIAENPYSTLNLVIQLRQNPLVEDIWVPVLSDDFEITKFDITGKGYYYVASPLDLLQSSPVRVSIIGEQFNVNDATCLTPYQRYLDKKNIGDFSISSEVLAQMPQGETVEDGKLTYSCFGEKTVLQHQGYQGASMVWQYMQKGSGQWVEHIETLQETLLAVTPETLVSVLCSVSSAQQDQAPQVFEWFSLSFVTSGDVDGNYKVNAKDALAILKHGVKKQMLTDELAVLLADCDKNDTIDAKDALLTLRKAVFK